MYSRGTSFAPQVWSRSALKRTDAYNFGKNFRRT